MLLIQNLDWFTIKTLSTLIWIYGIWHKNTYIALDKMKFFFSIMHLKMYNWSSLFKASIFYLPLYINAPWIWMHKSWSLDNLHLVSKIQWKVLPFFKNGVNALFVFIFWGHFYFGSYISIFPLLVPNPINACYFSPFCQPTDGNSRRGYRIN